MDGIDKIINPFAARLKQRKTLRAEREAKIEAVIEAQRPHIPDDEEVDCEECGEKAIRKYKIGRSSVIWPEGEAEPRFGKYWISIYCEGCERRIEREYEDKRLVEVQRRLDESGIARTLRLKRFDNYECEMEEQGRMLEAVEAFAEDHRGKWLALLGRSGTGKGHISAAIAYRILDRVNPQYSAHRTYLRCIKYLRLIRRIRSCYSNNESEESVIQKFQSPDLLIIDEIGLRGELSEWERSVIDDLLDARYEDEKTLIVTSNLTANDLFKLLGERVKSRFSERGEIINFKWDDYRPKLRGQR